MSEFFRPAFKPKNVMHLVIEGASQYGFNLLARAPVACARIFLMIGGVPGSRLPQEAWNDYY